MRVWERALRRARLPLAYSGGYNPRAKIQLARALPLGHVGEQEILDAWLEKPTSSEDVSSALMPVLPEGLTIKDVQQVDPKAPAMQTRVIATVYRVTIEWDGSREEIGKRLGRASDADELLHERGGRRYNLRPLIEDLDLTEATADTVTLRMQLSARPRATGRPEAVLDVLGLGEAYVRYYRERLILTDETEES
jgi:radical SAM-linked protein